MNIDVLIEIPKGSRNKYEYDKEKGIFRLDRVMFSPVHYPTDYGYMIDTLADDGDPLDALVLIWEPTFPGCVIQVRPIGVLQMSDEKGTDQKILCVPTVDPLWRDVQELDQVPQHLLKEIEHFFAIYKTLELKRTLVEGWQPRPVAEEIVRYTQEKFKKNQ
jgi:inorganic pyrophosphatase